MSVTITRAENGWIVTVPPEGDDATETWVFGGDGSDEVDDFADALRAVADLIGPTTSRHDAARVYVRVEPGDKWEGGKE